MNNVTLAYIAILFFQVITKIGMGEVWSQNELS